MSTSDKVLIFTSILLAAVALFVPYLSELLKRKLFAPRLKILFDENPPGCHKTRIRGRSPSDVLIEPVFYFRFMVLNIGRSQAKRCEAVLENMIKADAAGNYDDETKFTPINLIWGGSYGEYVEINPDRRFFCDLLHIPSAKYQEGAASLGHYVDPAEAEPYELGFILNVKAAFYSQPNRLPPGSYRLDVVVYSENAVPARSSFFVTWSGNWKETEENMFKELVIDNVSA